MTAGPERRTVELPDGRALSAVAAGPPDGQTLLFHTGTPGGLVYSPQLVDIAAACGFRCVLYSRPGYGDSSPSPGRLVADAAGDAAAILDAIGARRFVTAGWSGGGPHALATAALLRDRCTAAATIAGVAPFQAAGMDWFAGMAQENVFEFGVAARDEVGLTALLKEQAERSDMTGNEVADALAGLVTEPDRAALSGWFADYMAESMNAALMSGIAGWRDDDLALVRDWGFSLDQIAIPVAVWHGDQDAMVPTAHGEWLASHIPGARAHMLAGEGHLTLVSARFREILDDLSELAGPA
ncbi:MAG: alpha/beta hydrolase [Nocardiopsaceae bacterium]|jgi:pimeloyl-ACP methyl ester carboxylesterase|nr:alpha/beta hydrolase [Nocardiopsaceae bacterium]